ncbi:MAG TPA: hypothetical protein VER96_15125 [Polyangiaceae bacterium]|nr:hypothetical protein [Polyangiaceae bacterium]
MSFKRKLQRVDAPGKPRPRMLGPVSLRREPPLGVVISDITSTTRAQRLVARAEARREAQAKPR